MTINIPKIPFYFLRHGQTDWNLKKMIQGHTDIPLNNVGIKQAQKAQNILANCHITQIITSPLQRAHKTAKIINEHFKVPLHTHDGLKERFLGKLEGTVKTELALSDIKHNYTQSVEDSEPVEDFIKRISNTTNEILHIEENTLIVAHGGVYWALMNILNFGDQSSLNAIPYFFDPQKQSWLVKPVKHINFSNRKQPF